MKQIKDARGLQRYPGGEETSSAAMEGKVSNILNKFSGSRQTNRDEVALQQVIESYFWDEDDFEKDPPNGTAHY